MSDVAVPPYPIRNQLLAEMSGLVDWHHRDPDAGSLAVLRAMRLAGFSWWDLLGQTNEGEPLAEHPGYHPETGYVFSGFPSGWHRLCGRLLLYRAHWIPPFTLAEAAVLANLREPSVERVRRIDLLMTRHYAIPHDEVLAAFGKVRL